MKLAYSLPDGSVPVVHAAAKSDLEAIFGPLTDEAYEAHVCKRSIPANAVEVVRLPDDWRPPSEDPGLRHLWRLRDGNVIIEF